MDSALDMIRFSASVMDDPLVRDTWDRKYRYKLPDGSSPEATVADTRFRVVNGIYVNDKDMGAHIEAMDFVQRGLFIPAGRVNAGAGLDHNVTLINCFISETVQDSMPGIQRAIMRGALTLQGTGGLGTDWSTVRPADAIVVRGNSAACGVIPFMDQMDAMCKTIAVNDRRGALMATLRDDHPDVWNERQFDTTPAHNGDLVLKFPSFISAKRQKGRLTQCNMSILVSDAFLDALDTDADWDLGFHTPRRDGKHIDVYDKPFPYDMYDDDNEIVSDGLSITMPSKAALRIAKGTMLPWYVYRRVKARRIWNDIMRSTYVYAEPGVIFIDQVNRRNSLYYCEDIRCTNPCGEKPMPPDGICCLSSLNAAFMVHDPFTRHAQFDFEIWQKSIGVGVRFLDNVIDVSKYPLESQRREAQAKRRIGLGVNGWGDTLVQLGMRYGSPESVTISRKVASLLREKSYFESALLAKERGPFPLYNREKFLAGHNAKQLPGYVRDAIAEFGIRNGELNTIAPNGTISIYSGNTASGHEPVFSFEKTERKVRQSDNSFKTYTSVNYSRRLYESIYGETQREELPDYFVGAMDISVDDHLAVHAAWHEFIDASISKTINVPTEMSFDDFSHVYRKAYDLGCKGCTTYRPDPESGRGSVLSVVPEADTQLLPYPDLAIRPEVLPGMQYKLKWPVTGKNWYINITNMDGVPFEAFITASDAGAQEWVSALSRTITAVLRRGGDVRFLVDQLAEVHSALGGAFIPSQKQFRPSIVAAIAGVMETEFRRLGMYDDKPSDVRTDDGMMACTACGERTMVKESGCSRCLTCGFNSCG